MALGFQEYDWVDANGNRVYDVGEEGQLRADTRTDPSRLPSVDPDLKNSYTNVFTLGIERELAPNWALAVTGIVKRENDILGIVDAAKPFSAYQPITVTNPLDNRPLDIFTLPRALQAVRPQIVLTNPEEQDLRRNYSGVEVVLNRRLRDRWQMQASYVYGDAKGNVSNQYGDSDYAKYTNPNLLINRYGQLSKFQRHQVKLFGTWMAPHGFIVSGYFEALDGLPWRNTDAFLAATQVQGAATVRVFRRDFPQILSEDFVDVIGEPAGTRTLDTTTRLDARVEKRFPMGLGDLALTLDVFNVLNSGTTLLIQDLRLDNPRFGLPAEIQLPRQFRVAARWSF